MSLYMHEWTNVWMDEWMNERMNERMNDYFSNSGATAAKYSQILPQNITHVNSGTKF